MDHDIEREVAASLDADPELLPFLPDLLADLWSLGSPPDGIRDFLAPLELPADGTRVLDLACGKGAVGITLARDLGFRVDGIDWFDPFLDEARRRAKEQGVAERCRFVKGDVREAADRSEAYDVAVYGSVGAFGSADNCMGVLRGVVRPGGYIVIQNIVLAKSDVPPTSDVGHVASHDETRRMLTSHGDTLVRERVYSPEEQHGINTYYTEAIRGRAERLAETSPEHADLILGYVRRQEEASAVLEHDVLVVLWLLQRM